MKTVHLALVACLLAPAAFAQTMDHSKMPMSAAAGTGGPADKGFKAAMDKMHKDMAMKPSGKPDVDFVRGMIPHHQGAIDMAKVELQYGTDPELKTMAQEIIAAQEKEIAVMKGWLAKHGG